jgi:hypothetical protein
LGFQQICETMMLLSRRIHHRCRTSVPAFSYMRLTADCIYFGSILNCMHIDCHRTQFVN